MNKHFRLANVMAAASILTLAACDSSGESQIAQSPTQICTDKSGVRVDDSKCATQPLPSNKGLILAQQKEPPTPGQVQVNPAVPAQVSPGTTQQNQTVVHDGGGNGIASAFLWYYIGRNSAIPYVGQQATGGTYRPVETSYARSAFTSRGSYGTTTTTTPSGTVTRGGFGGTARSSVGSGSFGG